MNFSKSLIAVSALAFLASCTSNNPTTTTTETLSATTTTTTETPTETTTTVETATTSETVVTPTNEDSTTTVTTNEVSSDELSYNQVMDYTSPGGEDSVRFAMTTDKDGTITSLETTLMEGNQNSEMSTKNFADASKTEIVGKKISELSDITAVGGASLTTAAFKEFISDKQ